MTHHNLILALIQDVSVGHITVTKPRQTGHRLNQCVSIMMQCLVTNKMCKSYAKTKDKNKKHKKHNLSCALKAERRS